MHGGRHDIFPFMGIEHVGGSKGMGTILRHLYCFSSFSWREDSNYTDYVESGSWSLNRMHSGANLQPYSVSWESGNVESQ